MRKICETVEQNPDADIFLLERSIYSDRYFFVEMLHNDGHFPESEYKMYGSWWDMWKRIMPFEIDAFIYLKPSIDESMKRLHIRSREGEESVSKLYQNKLQEYHDKFFTETKIPYLLLTASANGNFKDDKNIQANILEQIDNFIKNIQNKTN